MVDRKSFAVGLVAYLMVSSSCQTQPEIRLEDFRGGSVTPHVPKVDFTLTDQNNREFNFRRDTDGYGTLLFFGYTYCPDICPIQMAQIASAIGELDEDVIERLKVVFVSVDPARDTPERLAQWLGAFHPSFIGLTGTKEEIDEIQRQMRFQPGVLEQTDTDNYGVSHASAVIGFTPDNVGRFLYFAGITRDDYVNDIPLLVRFTGAM